MSTSCPCGRITWTNGAKDGQVCPFCGRTHVIWSTGRTEWAENPAVVAVRRLHGEGQTHFRDVERELRKLRNMIEDLRRFTPEWRKAQAKKKRRRKSRS